MEARLEKVPELPGQGQIRSRERVRGLAEVYTHEREVQGMLDLIPGMFPSAADPGNTDRTFLEPACGHGNFLVAILVRKLEFVTARRYGRGERFEHRVLRCLGSIYGIDICEENVVESRERMRALLDQHVEKELKGDRPTAGFVSALETILSTNVVCADTLAEATAVELIEYRAGAGGTFVREWSRPLDPTAGDLNLLSSPARRDEVPVHYSELGCTFGPTVAPRKAA